MSKFSFDPDKFADALDATNDISVHNHNDRHGWKERDGNAMHYKYDNKYEYRTWRPDTSVCRSEGAIIISCKIDDRRGDLQKDDHIVLLAVFNRDGHLIAAEAGVESIAHGHQTGHTDPLIAKPATGNKHPDAKSDEDLARRLGEALQKVVDPISKDGQFRSLVHVTKDNLLAMQKAVSFK